MISAASPLTPPPILKFPTLRERQGDELFSPQDAITLRAYYERILLPDLIEQGAPATSLSEDRTAIKHWEQATGNPPLTEISSAHLLALRQALLTAGLAGPTINKTWRELRSILAQARDDGFIHAVPALSRRERIVTKGAAAGRSQLVPTTPKRQRPLVSEEEFAVLFSGCKGADYPRQGQFPAPRLWRVLLLLLWVYGPRVEDLIYLRWAAIDRSRKLLLFTAQKTRKLQGLPLTDVVLTALEAIRGHSERVFPHFDSPGGLLQGNWRPGWRTVWRRDLGGDRLQIHPKHLRERMVSYYEGLEPGLGAWVAGHSVPGVTAQHYDDPTPRIRKALAAASLPACLLQVDW